MSNPELKAERAIADLERLEVETMKLQDGIRAAIRALKAEPVDPNDEEEF